MGCATTENTEIAAERGAAATNDADFTTDRLLGWRRPPIIAADEPETVPVARLTAERIRWDELRARIDRTRYTTDTLPFLTATPEGRSFLSASPPRILARGMPEAACPAAVAIDAPRGTDRGELVKTGLRACIAALRPQHEFCGCRVVALDDMLTVPAEDMAFATGVAARLAIPSRGVDALLVSDFVRGQEILRDLEGAVALIERDGNDTVRIEFADGNTYAGTIVPVGYRRGRIAERIYATDDAGNRLSLLIGFSPDELAQNAARWLAWPDDLTLAGG